MKTLALINNNYCINIMIKFTKIVLTSIDKIQKILKIYYEMNKNYRYLNNLLFINSKILLILIRKHCIKQIKTTNQKC